MSLKRDNPFMLVVCLLFVGIVLINNGACTLMKVPPKAAAVMNIFVGGLSLFINFLNLIRGNYYAAGTGLLFCFTYLFVAVNNIFGLAWKPFAVFLTFVASQPCRVGHRRVRDGRCCARHNSRPALGCYMVGLGCYLGNIVLYRPSE